MSLIGLVMIFLLVIASSFIAGGAFLFRRNEQRKPTLLSVLTLLLQLMLFVLFFSNATAYFNELFLDVIWWVVVIGGFAVGFIKIKYNVIVSLVNIFSSGLLTVLMLLLMFITSM
ncbi:hypothetical protein P4679_25895 [Priestia megaterium]|uniref:hypothetical protein n=1 Tax=Priestia megaterium TaxID=1404 RepID=UPI002E1D7086|nr:hypothetical protein [Priestia megaterium]